MSWPLTPFRAMVDGSTYWDAALGNALQTAINGVYAATSSLLGLTVDGVGGQSVTASPGHIVAKGTTPTGAAQAAAGTGATVAVVGSDTAGFVNLVTGSAAMGTGVLFLVTLANAMPSSAFRVVWSAQTNDAATAMTKVYSYVPANNQWGMQTNSALNTGTSYQWEYVIVSNG